MAPSQADAETAGLSVPGVGPIRPLSLRFPPDHVVAQRFRIIRFLAHGGMGDVFEAFDLVLGTRVALKAIRAHLAFDDSVMERFRRETLLARLVTHANVCRIYDVFRHVDTRGEELDILSMELLEGETLAARLERETRLTVADALPLVQQMVAALAAAHAAGVVHRDFKCSNVIIVPGREGSESRLVVTDFGLARSISSDETGGSRPMVGTSAYMAPEQVRGGAITAAADVYALGIVIYEMVVGNRPFTADTPVATALSRLTDKPVPPRELRPDLDARWEAAILRCLEVDPADRFASVLDVLPALAASAPHTAAGPRPPRGHRAAILLATLATVAAAGAVAIARARPVASAPASTARSVPARRSVAVVSFKNLSGREDAAWLATALSEMLTSEVGATGKLRTIPGEKVSQMRADLALTESDGYTAETLGRIRANVGTDVVVSGSYLAVSADGPLRLNVHVQDAATGETLATLSESGTGPEILALTVRTGSALRGRLGGGELTVLQTREMAAARPANAQAARLYADGLARLRSYDGVAARALLQQAVVADPAYALAHVALSRACTLVGHREGSRSAAKTAFDLSAGLSQEDRLWIEGQYRLTTREAVRALEIYQALFTFHPDNVEYGLKLASAQTKLGRVEDMRITLRRLHQLPPPLRDDPRIDYEAALGTLQPLERLALLDKVAAGALRQGARNLLAHTRLAQGVAYDALGDMDRQRAAFTEAQQIYASTGNRKGEVTASVNLAIALHYAGQLTAARQAKERAREGARALG